LFVTTKFTFKFGFVGDIFARSDKTVGEGGCVHMQLTELLSPREVLLLPSQNSCIEEGDKRIKGRYHCIIATLMKTSEKFCVILKGLEA
jgi:hypothetical protein